MSKNKFCDSSLLDKAIVFASNAHKNTERKGKGFPYIAHPLEAMSIVATMTNDQELLAAACLHDVIEDTDVTYEDLKREFGKRVADLVQAESDIVVPNMSEGDSWVIRKQAQMDHLASASREVQMVAMGDKLSNMRALFHDYKAIGEDLWSRFHVTDPKLHEWHYRGLLAALSKLNDTEAYEEFDYLLEKTFGKKYGEFTITNTKEKIEIYGEINYENTLKIKELLSKEVRHVLDFTKAYSIDFSGVSELLNLYKEGYKFIIVNANKKVMHRLDVTGVTSFISTTNIPKEYNASNLTKAGEGHTAVTYFTPDGDAMIKVYNDIVDPNEVLKEKVCSLEALRHGILTPLSGDIVDIDGKKGIIFERIKGKASIARALADDYSRLDELAYEFALEAKKFHSIKCVSKIVPNAKITYKRYVDNFKGLSEEEKDKIKNFIDQVKDTGTCLHGDFHLGNVIITEDDKRYFIDLADFSYGNPLFDLGTMYFVSHADAADKTIEENFHSPVKVLEEFYDHFIKYYFVDMDKETVNAMLKPFAALTVIHFATLSYQSPWMEGYVRKNLLDFIDRGEKYGK